MNLYTLPEESDDWPPCLIATAVAQYLERMPPIRSNKHAPLTDAMKERAISMRKDGLSVGQISVALDMSENLVCKITKGVGAKYSPELIEEMRRLRTSGVSVDDTAERLGVSASAVRRHAPAFRRPPVPRATKICEECGNKFERSANLSSKKWDRRRGCSPSCSSKIAHRDKAKWK